MSKEERHAFITLVTTDGYASGALVLAHALRDHGTTKEIVCLITSNLSDDTIFELYQVFDHVLEVPELNSQSYDNLLLLGRLDLGVTLTKIYLWEQVQYDKVVFLDADTLPLRNVDELFERPEFAAAPDSGWPDCFNSGVFVAKPNHETYKGLYKMAKETGSFDGGDQGLLNTYFSDWSTSDSSHRLPFIYNTTPTAVYSYLPAYTAFHSGVSIIHFIGSIKPWHWTKFSDGKLFPKGNATAGLVDLAQKWWNVWEKYYGNSSPVRHSKYDIPITSRNQEVIDFSTSRYTSIWRDERDIPISVSDRPAAPMPPLLADNSRSVDIESGWSAPHDISVMVDAPPVVVHHYQAPPAPPAPPHPQAPSRDDEYGFINWNPAYEEPPDRNPHVVDIPSFGRYSNAWDLPFDRGNPFVSHIHHFSAPAVLNGIPPPPKYNPSMTPPVQISHVFPWEHGNGPQFKPSRIWLDEEAARKERERIERLEYEAAAAAAAAAANFADQGRRDSGYNDDSHFVNAWDTMPSISRYLARLQGEDVAERKAAAIAVANKSVGVASRGYSSDFTAKYPEISSAFSTNNFRGYREPSALVGRNKSQMFAKHPRTGPTPYTSAATTPTAEYPPHLDDNPEDITASSAEHSSGHSNDLDIHPIGWASDLQRVPQSDDTAASTRVVNRPRAGFDVTPSISPPQGSPSDSLDSHQRHHFRAPSGRSNWNPDEALDGVRHASIIFGGLEGGEAAMDEEERLSSYYRDKENEDLGALGLRIDSSQKDVAEEGNNLTLTDEEKKALVVGPDEQTERFKLQLEDTSFESSASADVLPATAGGVGDMLDSRQGGLSLQRANRENPLPVDEPAALPTAQVSAPYVLDRFTGPVRAAGEDGRDGYPAHPPIQEDSTIMAPGGDASSAATALGKETAAIDTLDVGELKARLEEVQLTTTATTVVTTGVDIPGAPVTERKLSGSASPTMYGRPNLSRKTSDSGESSRLGRNVSVMGSATTVRRALSPSITERIEVMYGADAVVPEARGLSPRLSESHQRTFFTEIREAGGSEGELQIDPASMTTTIFRSSSLSGDTLVQETQDVDLLGERDGITVLTSRSDLVLEPTSTFTSPTTFEVSSVVKSYSGFPEDDDDNNYCHVTEIDLEKDDDGDDDEEDSDGAVIVKEVHVEEVTGDLTSFESLDIEEEE